MKRLLPLLVLLADPGCRRRPSPTAVRPRPAARRRRRSRVAHALRSPVGQQGPLHGVRHRDAERGASRCRADVLSADGRTFVAVGAGQGEPRRRSPGSTRGRASCEARVVRAGAGGKSPACPPTEAASSSRGTRGARRAPRRCGRGTCCAATTRSRRSRRTGAASSSSTGRSSATSSSSSISPRGRLSPTRLDEPDEKMSGTADDRSRDERRALAPHPLLRRRTGAASCTRSTSGAASRTASTCR